MNHIYRVIYNATTNTYQAVPENSTGKHKSASEKSPCALSDDSEKGAFFSLKPMALCAMAMGLSSTNAFAAPVGGVLSAGEASIQQHGKITNIHQTSPKAAINWQQFGIQADETVNFRQPDSQAVILNRVIGKEKSVIDGAMNANGKVFISNPNGMLIGKNAQINVGSLIASTGKISNQDFMNGVLKFDQATGAITQLGDIKVPTGGVVALIAPIVANKGKIAAPQGKVLLASAEQFSITLPENGFDYTLSQGTLQGLVDNGGAILADGGHVVLTAKGVDAVKKSLIQHTGLIEANTVQNKNGVIELLGDLDNTRLEASGSLKAEAHEKQGDGGFIETSAAEVSIRDLSVSTKSKFGKTGEWLIDPQDFTINEGTGAHTNTGIGAETLSSNLQNTNVNIATVTEGNEKGDIYVNAPVSWDKNTLTLSAHNNIYIHENLNGSGDAKLVLKYGQATPDGIQADGTESDYSFYPSDMFKKSVINLPASNNFVTQRGSSPENVRHFQVIHADRLDGRLLPENVAIGEDIDLSGKILSKGLDGVKVLHGLGHQINNLTIDHTHNIERGQSPQHIGFLNELKGGGIRDLTLNDVNIKTKINDDCGGKCNTQIGVSGLVGYAEHATIKNVLVSGKIKQPGDYLNIVKQNDLVGLEGEKVYYKITQPTNNIIPIPKDTNNQSSTVGNNTSTPTATQPATTLQPIPTLQPTLQPVVNVVPTQPTTPQPNEPKPSTEPVKPTETQPSTSLQPIPTLQPTLQPVVNTPAQPVTTPQPSKPTTESAKPTETQPATSLQPIPTLQPTLQPVVDTPAQPVTTPQPSTPTTEPAKPTETQPATSLQPVVNEPTQPKKPTTPSQPVVPVTPAQTAVTRPTEQTQAVTPEKPVNSSQSQLLELNGVTGAVVRLAMGNAGRVYEYSNKIRNLDKDEVKRVYENVRNRLHSWQENPDDMERWFKHYEYQYNDNGTVTRHNYRTETNEWGVFVDTAKISEEMPFEGAIPVKSISKQETFIPIPVSASPADMAILGEEIKRQKRLEFQREMNNVNLHNKEAESKNLEIKRELEKEQEGLGTVILDGAQTLLDAASLAGVTGVGEIISTPADIANALISAGRAKYHHSRGEHDKAAEHSFAAGASAAGIIPFINGGAAKGVTYVAKETMEETAEQAVKEATREAAEKVAAEKTQKNASSIYRQDENNPNVFWVKENAHMNMNARGYNDSTVGARSDWATKSSLAPAIYNPLSGRFVRFDGLSPINNNSIIDSKYGIYVNNKTRNQIIRQSSAAEANGMHVIWQVPTEKVLNRAYKTIEELDIKNILLKIRKPD